MANCEPINKPQKNKIKVVRYKRYIRMMVEMATIHESKNYEKWREAMKIFAENPTSKYVTPWWVWTMFIAFMIGVLTTVYTFTI